MTSTIEMIGRRFGRLSVLRMAEKRGTRSGTLWVALCDCGTETVVDGYAMRSGRTKSCGCLVHDAHGHNGTLGKSPTYYSWQAMRKRCLDPRQTHYDRYGGAGVTICERWEDFRNFLADMGERPAGKTLDRYPDHAGNYEPNNCRWATKREQAQNRKDNVFIEIDGERKCIADWARTYGIRPGVIRQRIALQGWEPIRAVTQPARSFNRRNPELRTSP